MRKAIQGLTGKPLSTGMGAYNELTGGAEEQNQPKRKRQPKGGKKGPDHLHTPCCSPRSPR